MGIENHQLSQARRQKWVLPLSLGLLLVYLVPLAYAAAEHGTAARYGYNIPYTPTRCYYEDTTAFPANNLYAAAGEAIWNHGRACGKQYKVTCISAAAPNTCIPGTTITVKIVDRASTAVYHPSTTGATLALSTAAFNQLVKPSTATSINIQFEQV